MLDDDHTMRLVERIYDTLIDPDEYDRTMTDVLAATGSHFMLLTSARVGETAHIAPRFIGDLSSRMLDGMDDYAAGAVADDLTLAFVAANPAAGFFSTDIHLDHDAAATQKYVAWNRHYLGNTHWQARFDATGGLIFGASLHPRSPDEPHCAQVTRKFELLFRHMTRATRLAAQPVRLDDQAEALVALNAAGLITAMSPSAKALLEASDGLHERGGELLPSDPRLWTRWRELVRAVIRDDRRRHEDAAVLVRRRASTKPLAVTICAQAPAAGFAYFSRGALIRIIDPDAAPADVTRSMMQLWQLTPAEARLVQVLVENGFALRDAGERLGITYATVRTQLASVYAKTDTRGQPELMRLVTRLSH